MNLLGLTLSHRAEREDFNPLDRTTVPDVIRAIHEQTSAMFRTTDFVPLPCHSDCISMTYAYVNGKKVKPLPRYIDVKAYLDVIGNQINFKVDDMKDVVGSALMRLWSASMPLSTANALRDFSCCLPVAPQALSQTEHGSLLYENMFRIVIIAFMDAWNFDVRSAKKCCVHTILPDGKIIPFCSYNTVHRPKTLLNEQAGEYLGNHAERRRLLFVRERKTGTFCDVFCRSYVRCWLTRVHRTGQCPRWE